MSVDRLESAELYAIVDSAPDYPEPIVGWRAWRVATSPGPLRLASVMFDTVWSPRAALRATCLNYRRPRRCPWRLVPRDHSAPDPACTCGMYAAPRVGQALPYLGGSVGSRPAITRVIGRVSLWGSVLECEQGWRGACAYPLEIYVLSNTWFGSSWGPEQVATRLGVYGVPVEVVDSSAAARSLAEPDSDEWAL